MQKNSFFGFFALFSQLAAIWAIASSGCGDSAGPSGLSSNPQDWPVPPRCDSRFCEVEAQVASMCVGLYPEWEWAERVGTPCEDEDPCDDGVYVCAPTKCDPFLPPFTEVKIPRYSGRENSGCPDPNWDKTRKNDWDTSSNRYMGWIIHCEGDAGGYDLDTTCNGIDDNCNGKIDDDRLCADPTILDLVCECPRVAHYVIGSEPISESHCLYLLGFVRGRQMEKQYKECIAKSQTCDEMEECWTVQD